MLAVVKMPHIDIQIEGDIPPKLLAVLQAEYGENVQLSFDSDEETIDVFETGWYQEIKSQMTPGDNLRIYRQNHGWTQAQLGEKLGGVRRQHISNMERGHRAISIATARKLTF